MYKYESKTSKSRQIKNVVAMVGEKSKMLIFNTHSTVD